LSNPFIVIQGSIWNPPDLTSLIEEHRNGDDIMTVVFQGEGIPSDRNCQAAGIYICDAEVLEFIPDEGYCDIKETLIPAIVRKGGSVRAATWRGNVGTFRDKNSYLRAMANILGEPTVSRLKELKGFSEGEKGWRAPDAIVAESAQIIGPVVLMPGCEVEKDAMVMGPAIVGRNVRVREGAVIDESVLWSGVNVGADCFVQHSLVSQKVKLAVGSQHVGEAVTQSNGSLWSSLLRSRPGHSSWRCQSPRGEKTPLTMAALFSSHHAGFYAMLIGIFSAFIFSYWPQIMELMGEWRRSDEYSVCALVPFIAGFVLWIRRRSIGTCAVKPMLLLGGIGCLAAQGLRGFGSYYMYDSIEKYSIILTVMALTLMLFGWSVFRKVLTVCLFLFLMLPLPNRVQESIGLPLQKWATASAEFSLGVVNYEVGRDGNIIHLRGDTDSEWTTVAVAEACNGLRMITAFVIICAMVVLLMNKPGWAKLIGLLASLPIALMCNTIRLTITAVAFTFLSQDEWELFFHDFGGLAMMPLALVIILLLFYVLDRIFIGPAVYEEGDLLISNRAVGEER
jgi:exosortase